MFSLHPSLYFFLQFLFQLFLMSTLVPDEISMEDPLCNSSFGSMVTLDYVTPVTLCRSFTRLLCATTSRRHSCRDAEAVSQGPAYFADHSDSPAASVRRPGVQVQQFLRVQSVRGRSRSHSCSTLKHGRLVGPCAQAQGQG